ncbi:cell division protein CrgA [Kocuria tytonicola]|uniref:cell division protein CrgA n=1 Tax=Kocuria tytonicola TaxID=2055946 RepID=UPI001401E806|nr:cell division protein CrgA [Kocuria tytonicola]
MSQPRKRFGRPRDAQEDAQQFTLTERDRELAALAAEILPRNSAAASFERAAARNAGSSSVAARDAVTDTELVGGDSAAATGAHGSRAEDTTVEDTTEGATTAASGTHQAVGRRAKGRAPRGAAGAGAAAASSTTGTTAGTARSAAHAGDTTASDSPESEPTPMELKQQRKRERQAQRRAERAAKAEERERRATDYQPTPLWYKIVMIGLMIVGLLWIITFYLFQGVVPIPGIGQWNLFIGLGFMLAGLIMTTRWR